MKLSEKIHLEIFKTSDKKDNPIFSAVSAIKLISIPSVRLREINPQGYPISYFSKQIDLINSLHQTQQSITYAIRYISTPNPWSFSGGKIECCIFCKISGDTKEYVHANMEEQIEQLLIQLCGTLPDYVWQAITTQEEFNKFWQPIPWKKANIIEIRRREELIFLDSIQRYRPIGFSNQEPYKQEEYGCPIYFVHPFLPHPGQLERLLRVMLLNQSPVVFTVTLTPTGTTQEEEKGLLDEIAHSEGFQFDPSPRIQRIQEQRARMISQEIMQQYLTLQDAPFFVRVSLASLGKITQTLAETAGVGITASIGEGVNPIYTEPTFIQMGGYDVVEPANLDEVRSAQRNSEFLESCNWGKSLGPEKLQRIRFLMAGQESANAFHFPEDGGNGLAGMDVHTQRTRQIPLELLHLNQNINKSGLLLGTNNYLGIPQEVTLPNKDRLTHMYLVGQTGTGKSTLMKTMLLSDIYSGRGCALIDPHGDLYEELIGLIPPERIKDVVLFDPSDIDFPVGLNLLEAKDNNERYFIVREMQAIMRRLLEDQFGTFTSQQIAGPVFYQHMQMNMLLAMSNPEDPGTLLEYYQIYQSNDYWKRWIPLRVDDPQLKAWVESYLSHNNYTDEARGGEASMGSWLSSKFTDFIFDPRLMGIFSQKRSTVDFQKIMNEGKILLINLAKGLLGDSNSRFLGLILMAKIQAELMKRAKIPQSKRNPFYLYVDEFQSLATENFTVLLSEARKFGLGLILANQFISQIKDERIIQSVFGNVGSFLSFRLGREDSLLIEPQFLPYFDRMDLANLPNWQVATRVTVNGKGQPPFTLLTVLPDKQMDLGIAEQVRNHSRQQYGTAKARVEEIIQKSMMGFDAKSWK